MEKEKDVRKWEDKHFPNGFWCDMKLPKKLTRGDLYAAVMGLGHHNRYRVLKNLIDTIKEKEGN